jgi:DNA-binding NarL/FixJ family response regulator
MIRVLLADDQALVRAGFRALLDAQEGIEVVGEANDGEEAVRLASQLVPDVVLMDIRMPGTDGLEATRRILHDQRLDRVRIVLLTTFDVDEYVFEALRVGASGFLVKDTDPGELVHGVRAVARGDALLSPGVARRLISAFADRGGDQALPAGSGLGRVLATVMFSDIVSSTERAAAIGDRRWRDLLDRHDAVIRRALARHGGREVKTTGDGFLVLFDGPARAIRCALAIRQELRAESVEVRIGLHAGEVEMRGDDVGGIAVHLGARVVATASPGDVVVSSTVRDLVAGSGIGFVDRVSTTSRECRTDGTCTPSPNQAPLDPPGSGEREDLPFIHLGSLATRLRRGPFLMTPLGLGYPRCRRQRSQALPCPGPRGVPEVDRGGGQQVPLAGGLRCAIACSPSSAEVSVVWSSSTWLRRSLELVLLCFRSAQAKEIEILVLRHELAQIPWLDVSRRLTAEGGLPVGACRRGQHPSRAPGWLKSLVPASCNGSRMAVSDTGLQKRAASLAAVSSATSSPPDYVIGKRGHRGSVESIEHQLFHLVPASGLPRGLPTTLSRGSGLQDSHQPSTASGRMPSWSTRSPPAGMAAPPAAHEGGLAATRAASPPRGSVVVAAVVVLVGGQDLVVGVQLDLNGRPVGSDQLDLEGAAGGVVIVGFALDPAHGGTGHGGLGGCLGLLGRGPGDRGVVPALLLGRRLLLVRTRLVAVGGLRIGGDEPRSGDVAVVGHGGSSGARAAGDQEHHADRDQEHLDGQSHRASSHPFVVVAGRLGPQAMTVTAGGYGADERGMWTLTCGPWGAAVGRLGG